MNGEGSKNRPLSGREGPLLKVEDEVDSGGGLHERFRKELQGAEGVWSHLEELWGDFIPDMTIRVKDETINYLADQEGLWGLYPELDWIGLRDHVRESPADQIKIEIALHLDKVWELYWTAMKLRALSEDFAQRRHSYTRPYAEIAESMMTLTIFELREAATQAKIFREEVTRAEGTREMFRGENKKKG